MSSNLRVPNEDPHRVYISADLLAAIGHLIQEAKHHHAGRGRPLDGPGGGTAGGGLPSALVQALAEVERLSDPAALPDLAYRPGPPSLEQVRAHEARGGRWHFRRVGQTDEPPTFYHLTADDNGRIWRRWGPESVSSPVESGSWAKMDGEWKHTPPGASEMRPVLLDGTPVCWRTLGQSPAEVPAALPADVEALCHEVERLAQSATPGPWDLSECYPGDNPDGWATVSIGDDVVITLAEDTALRERMSDLLTRTADALKGSPGPLRLHDWSNLPEVAASARQEVRRLIEVDENWQRWAGKHVLCDQIAKERGAAQAALSESEGALALACEDVLRLTRERDAAQAALRESDWPRHRFDDGGICRSCKRPATTAVIFSLCPGAEWRAVVEAVACERCGAQIGAWCIGPEVDPVPGAHLERVGSYYRAAAQEPAPTQPETRDLPALEYRPGLPSVDQVRAHEAIGTPGCKGCWLRLPWSGVRKARIVQLQGRPDDGVDEFDDRWRPCLPDGTPCAWPTQESDAALREEMRATADGIATAFRSTPLDEILADVHYADRRFITGPMGDGYYLQIAYTEADVETGQPQEHHGRKWYVSRHATRGEVVQTALKAALTSAEHQVREHFLYKGRRIFGPHFDLDALVAICEDGGTKRRS